jgi:outer membrane protein assembly factor BamB
MYGLAPTHADRSA